MKRQAVKGVLILIVLLGGLFFALFPPGMVWHTEEARAFDVARQSGRHVLIDFGAEWCGPCVDTEKIMARRDVSRELEANFVLLRFDVTQRSDENAALQKRYRARRLPAVVFATADRKELGRYQPKEKPTKKAFLASMRAALAKQPLEQQTRR